MKHLILALVVSVFALPLQTDRAARLDIALGDGFQYRNLGPFRAGSWVSDIAVPESPMKSHLYTFYVAARSGGVWKTTNNGTTFEPVFDNQNVASIGALALAPSAGNIVWVGAGAATKHPRARSNGCPWDWATRITSPAS